MTITGNITATVLEAIIGAMARLALPGRQDIPIWLTNVVDITVLPTSSPTWSSN